MDAEIAGEEGGRDGGKKGGNYQEDADEGGRC